MFLQKWAYVCFICKFKSIKNVLLSDSVLYINNSFLFRYYTKARKVLHQYQHMASFQGIQEDCNKIVSDLSQTLRQQFRDKEVRKLTNFL